MKKLLCMILTLAMLLSLAACGGSKDAAGTPNSSNLSSNNDPANGNSSGENQEVTLRVSTNLSNVTFDTMQTHQSYMVGAVFGQLMEMDADCNFLPHEATEWELEPDGMSATITLRNDMYFTSGNKVTSKDLQFTLMRPVNDRTMVSARTYKALENVEIVDEYTVKLVMNAPWPTCIEDIYNTQIVDSADFEARGEDAYFLQPSTCGPFKVVTFDPVNSSYELERFDGWWGWDVIDNPTNVDRFFYTLSAEDTTRVSALRTGEFDLIELVPFDDVAVLETEGFKTLQTVENRHVMIGFNYESLFGDPALREAVSLAVDRNLIVNSIIGVGWPATWSWFAGVAANPGYNGYPCDMERAKQLVAENYDGTEFSILVSSAATTRVNELAQAIQSMLLEAGFNVKINMVEEATYDVMRSSSQYEMAIGVFNTPATGEAYKEVCEILGGDIFGTNYDDPELVDLIAKVQGNCDSADRAECEKAVYKHVVDNYGPYIYLYCTTGIVAANDRVDLPSMNMDCTGNWSILHVQVKN